jgi:uncharacterized membrane protein YheB (UPF0754 family)
LYIDKSLATTLGAAAVTLLALLLPPPYQFPALSAGLFALSGALTNWLAVHMLFERIPGFYGSGVITLHFQEFKRGIRKLIMQQFFNRENIDSFIAESGKITADLDQELLKMVDEVDLEGAFESLLDVIMASSFASMLGFIGGRDAFKSLREPFTSRMRDYLHQTVASADFQQKLGDSLSHATASLDLQGKIEKIVDRRLDELTPTMVKEIVEDMIRQHLGWLVVWGGVLGGLMGLLVALVSSFL